MSCPKGKLSCKYEGTEDCGKEICTRMRMRRMEANGKKYNKDSKGYLGSCKKWHGSK